MKWLAPLLSITVIFAALRIYGEKSESFQALAHLYFAGLAVGGWDRIRFGKRFKRHDMEVAGYTCAVLAVLLFVVESFCFVRGFVWH